MRIRLNFTTIYNFVLCAMFTVAFNNIFRTVTWLWYMVAILCIVMSLYSAYRQNTFVLNDVVKWGILFVLYCLISAFWNTAGFPTTTFNTTLLSIVITMSLSIACNTKKKIDNMVSAIYFAILVSAVYLFRLIDFSNLSSVRLANYLGIEWNDNQIGTLMAIGCVLAVYYFLKSTKFIIKLLQIPLAAICFALVMISGSRTSLLILLLSIIGVLLFRYKGIKVVAQVFVILFVLWGVYKIVNLYKPFYDIIGYRIEGLIEGLTTGSGDASYDERAEMIRFGLGKFVESPIWGYGFDSFRNLYKAFGGGLTYSHCNLVETVVSGGIIGFFVYYWLFIKLTIQYIKKILRTNNNMYYCLGMGLLVSLLACQFFAVTYYKMEFNTILLLIYLICNIKNLEDSKEL